MKKSIVTSVPVLLMSGFVALAGFTLPSLAFGHTTGESHVHTNLNSVQPTVQVVAAPSEGSKKKGDLHGGKGYAHGSKHGAKEGSKGGHHASKAGGGHGKKKCDKAKSGGSHGKKACKSRGKHGYASGGHKGHGHGRNPFKHVLRYAGKLGLSDAQLSTIKDKQFEYAIAKIQREADHTIAHMELDRLVHSGELDESAIRAVGERLSAVKAASIKAMIEAKIGLLQVLSPEQRKKIASAHPAH